MKAVKSQQISATNGANKAFSRQALLFDRNEANNPVAQWARQSVRIHVLKHLNPADTMLELNAGTGQDALFFAERGIKVLATDQSGEMIRQAELKSADQNGNAIFQTAVCGLTQLNTLSDRGPFDFAFSNFGGLNCIPDPEKTAEQLSELIRPGGKVTVVILAPVCPWELISVFTGRTEKAFRRLRKGPVIAHIEGICFPVWYYNASSVIRKFKPWFSKIDQEGLAAFTPPPYKPDFPGKYPRLFSLMNKTDNLLKRMPPFDRIGDYIIITFQKD